jgi:hypothetical protein
MAGNTSKGVVHNIVNGAGVVKTKVVTQSAGKLVQRYIDEIKRNADAVRGKGYASKQRKKSK